MFATHDEALADALIAAHGDALREPGTEFEMLMGVGTGLLDRLHGEGYTTREYVILAAAGGSMSSTASPSSPNGFSPRSPT